MKLLRDAQFVGKLALLTAAALFAGPVSGLSDDNDVIIAHGISKFGDLKYDADFKRLEYVNPDAPKGGEISIWAEGTFDSMNPYSTSGRAGGLSHMFYESLLTGTADEVSSSYGLLAASLEYPKDRSWVIFNIRPEARFSDGSPLTEQDVLFSYKLLREQGLPSYRAELRRAVMSAEILAPLRIKFEFNPGIPTLSLPAMVGSIPVFSKAWFDSTGARLDESRLQVAPGSGPYVLDSFDPSRQIIYRRNPDYWGSHLPINQGQNNFDQIRVEYYGDTAAAFEAFKSGEYTFRNENLSVQWATGYDFPAIEKGWAVKQILPHGFPARGQSFVFNLRRQKFQDIRVREALGLMFNFEWSNNTLFYDLYARINSFWENSHLAASGLPDEHELELLEPLRGMVSDAVFNEPARLAPTSSADRSLDRRNLRKASALLDEAGWIVGDDGVRRNAAGKALTVEFLEDSLSFERIINPFVENLRAAGVDSFLTRVDPAQYTNRTRSHDFDIITTSFGFGLEPSGPGLRQYLGSEHVDSVFNDPGLANKAVDQLIDHIQEAKTPAELQTAVKALDRVLRTELFWVPQWYKAEHTVAYYDMYERPDNLPPYSLGHLSFWWFNPEKADRLTEAGAF